MKCPRCSHENRPAAKFCEQCAAPLVRNCRGCGSALPEKARFCPECGHPAESAAGEPAPAPAPAKAPAPEGERRQAAVLFADISGYTRLVASTDAEQVQALLNRFYALTDRTIASYGGNVIDHAGDGVLAVFGAPVAYGNDPERAVRAALDLHTGTAKLVDASAEPLKLHAGIASGEVVAAVISGGATPKYAVTGDTVNLAARLASVAEAGDTVLSQSVQRNLAELVETADLGEHALKGFSAPVQAYRLIALRHAVGERLPLAGRQAELRQLFGALDNVRETRTGVAIAIRGEPGIGKTRLTEELQARAASQGFACHIGRALDFGVSKHQEALPSIVAAILEVASNAREPLRRAALARGIETGLIDSEHELLLTDLLDLEQRPELRAIFDAMDSAVRQRRTAAALADLVKRVARERPRVIVVEDIHWGSPLLLECLAALAAATRQAPVVLAMTTRVEGDPLDRQWRAASHGTPLLTIDLGPLNPEEARRLAEGVIDSANRTALECIERAEGNPLFLEQLLRNAKESESASIPPTIQSLVLARMDRLAARDKLALQAASAIGKRFTLEALRFLIDDATYRCEAPVAADLVRADAGEYLFANALIQEGVYASLLNTRKRELHGRAAEWYGEAEPVLRAEHLDRAQDPRAAHAYLSAARAEAQHSRHAAALRLAQRGAELVQDGGTRCPLALLRGDLLREMASTQESIAAFDEALQAAGDDEQRARAWLGLAAGRRITGETAAAMDALASAQPVAERLELWDLCSRIHSMRGNLHFGRGEIEQCGAEHGLALECARRAGDAECEALALSGLGDHAYAQGRMLTGLGHFQRCVELCVKAGLVRTEIPNRCMVGHCLNWTGQGDAGVREIQRSVDLSNRVGLAQFDVVTLESMALVLVYNGAYEEAEPWLQKAIAAARQAGARRFLATDLLVLATCRRATGRLAEAREALAEAHELSKQIGMGFLGPGVLAAKAQLAEDPAERKRLLQEGEQLLAGGCIAHAYVMFYGDAIDAVLDDKNWSEALRYADKLEAYISSERMAFAELIVARARVLAAFGQRGRDPTVLAELAQVRERILHTGLRGLLPKLDAALKGGD